MLEHQDGPAAGRGSAPDTHSLLLSLAGLIDDELLGWGRELAAVGQLDYALDLITSAITADQVALPEPVHAALRAARLGSPEVQLPAPDPAPVMQHRFLADPLAAGYPEGVASAFSVQALRTLPTRILRGCRSRLSWRLTPTGSAPTPVPHPVLLVETPDAAGADLLAYQVADLLWQAGVFASVEVFAPDTPLGEYHRAALAASVTLEETDQSSADTPSAPPSAPRAEPADVPIGASRPPAGAQAPVRTQQMSQERPPSQRQAPRRDGVQRAGSNAGGPERRDGGHAPAPTMAAPPHRPAQRMAPPPPVRPAGPPPFPPPPPGRPPIHPPEMTGAIPDGLRLPRMPRHDEPARAANEPSPPDGPWWPARDGTDPK